MMTEGKMMKMIKSNKNYSSGISLEPNKDPEKLINVVHFSTLRFLQPMKPRWEIIPKTRV